MNVMEQKLKAAMAARKNPDFVIIGRTDAYGAVKVWTKRCGAASISSDRRRRHIRRRAENGGGYARVGKAFKGSWNCAAIFEGTATPWLTPGELHGMGFSQIAYPNILIGRVAKAIEKVSAACKSSPRATKNAFAGGGQELALRSLADALDLKKWNDVGEEILLKSAQPLMQPAVDRQQERVDAGGEDDQQKRHRHDHVDVIKPDRVHQQIAQAVLRGEHLAEHGADQRQRKADAQCR